MAISSLGYLGITSRDPQAWLRLGVDLLGMVPAHALPGEYRGLPGDPGSPGPASRGSGSGPDGSVYLKLDDWEWRVAVHRTDGPEGLAYLGFDTENARGFAQTVAALQAEGIAVEISDRAGARARSVTQLARLQDPSGNAIELFWGPTIDRRFQSPLGARFVTGTLGCGHINLFVAQIAPCLDFYTQVLGFAISDYLNIDEDGDLSANFLYCNPRHHSVALTRVGETRGVHHIMFQLETIDLVGQAMDRIQKDGWRITSSLGRHVNDGMLSFYFRGPSGFDIEIGCDGLLIEENWIPNQFCGGDVWGHHGLTPQAIVAMADEMPGR